MFLQDLSNIRTEREMTAAFPGLDRNARIEDGYNADEMNLSADEYPVLNERPLRTRIHTFTNCKGLVAHEALAWVDNRVFYYNGSCLDANGNVMTLPSDFSAERQLIPMGAYICIFPDNRIFNTQDRTLKPIQTITNTGASSFANHYPCTLQLGDWDGDKFKAYTVGYEGPTQPSSPTEGYIWLDTATNTLKHYSGGMWYAFPTVYVRLGGGSVLDFSDGYEVGQTVSFSAYYYSSNVSSDVKIIYQEYITIEALVDRDPNNDDHRKDIIFAHELPTASYSAVKIYMARRGRTMDYVTELDNRLWGCNSANHEIYASALGDPFTWRKFQNVASDSYSVTVGTPGKFTGACSHLGYVLFFKNDVIHKVYGSKPTNYQLMTTEARGVQDGSWKSLCKVNETLYYKSDKDVCAFTTGLPQGVSEKLGTFHYKNAVSGRLGDELYITMTQDGESEPVTYVFSISKGIWHKVDIKAKYYATLGNELYYVGTDDKLYSVKGTYNNRYRDAGDSIAEPTGDPSSKNYREKRSVTLGTETFTVETITSETSVTGGKTYYKQGSVESEAYTDWSFTSGEIGLIEPDAKYVSKIQLRMSVEKYADVSVSYEDGEWEKQFHIENSDRRSTTVHIVPKRCDYMRIRVSGRGRLRLYSMTKYIEGATEYGTKSSE